MPRPFHLVFPLPIEFLLKQLLKFLKVDIEGSQDDEEVGTVATICKMVKILTNA